jgi:hypothetical protein
MAQAAAAMAPAPVVNTAPDVNTASAQPEDELEPADELDPLLADVDEGPIPVDDAGNLPSEEEPRA